MERSLVFEGTSVVISVGLFDMKVVGSSCVGVRVYVVYHVYRSL